MANLESGFPASVANGATGSNPNTIRAWQASGVLTVDRSDQPGHTSFTLSDLIRISMLQKMVKFGMSVRRGGRRAADAAAHASLDMRAMTSDAPWLVLVQEPEEDCEVFGPFSDDKLVKGIVKAGGIGLVVDVDAIWNELEQKLIEMGALKARR